jgi:hypothetical protein
MRKWNCSNEKKFRVNNHLQGCFRAGFFENFLLIFLNLGKNVLETLKIYLIRGKVFFLK